MILPKSRAMGHYKLPKWLVLIAVSCFALLSANTWIDRKQQSYTLSDLHHVQDLIEQESINHNSKSEMYKNAIMGTVNGVDSFSFAQERNDAGFSLTEQHTGLGARVSAHDEGLMITQLFSINVFNSHNIHAGAIISHFNDLPVKGNVERFSETLQTKNNITLTVIQGKDSRLINVTPIDYDVNSLHAFIYYMEDKPWLFIKLSSFTEGVASDLHQQLQDINFSPLAGILLDMSDNSGGFVDEAIYINDLFIHQPHGLMLFTQGNNQKEEYFFTDLIDVTQQTPLFVVQNKGSASAAELVAGTLQHFNRATILGETSYGKGVGQSVFQYKGLDLGITTFEYIIGKNKRVHKVGVTPDHQIPHSDLNVTNITSHPIARKAYELLNQTVDAKKFAVSSDADQDVIRPD
jgi:carboxyl-terminal processing protease